MKCELGRAVRVPGVTTEGSTELIGRQISLLGYAMSEAGYVNVYVSA